MKPFLRKRLRETIIGGEYNAYHGTSADIIKFSDEFVGGNEAIDQEGPGIYFTTIEKESYYHGNKTYNVTLSPRKLMDTTPIRPTKWRTFVTKMLKAAPEWKDTAQNFDENPNRGLIMAVEAMMEYNDTEKDLAQQIWYDFYRYKPVDFVRNMVKMGIDGIMVPKDESKHIIVYNPAIIRLNKVINT